MMANKVKTSSGQDLARVREDAVTIIRGLAIVIGLAVSFWVTVSVVAWRVAEAIARALS